MKLDLLIDIVVVLASLLSTVGFFVGLLMLVIRPWRQRGKRIFFGSTAIFIVALMTVGASVDRDARNAGFADATDRRKATEAGFANSTTWNEFKVREAKRVKIAARPTAKAKPESTDTGTVGAILAQNKSILKHLLDGNDQQKSSETNVAIWTPTESPTSQVQSPTQPIETHYVKGTHVMFRAGPGTNHKVLGKFNTGRELEYLGERVRSWSHVRDRTSQRDGWIATRYTATEMPEQKPTRAKKDPSPKQVAKKRNCHPSYSGCLDPNASDYDCAGGRGNGPKYTGRVRVLGPDVFRLDRDKDGIGCE